MSQLPTNPILARSGTSVLIGEYQQDSPSMLLQATRPHSPLDASQSYQRSSSAAGGFLSTLAILSRAVPDALAHRLMRVATVNCSVR